MIDVSLQDGNPDVKKEPIEDTNERVEIINTNTQNGFKLGSNGVNGINGVHVITGQRVTNQPQTLRPKGQLPIAKSINSKIITIQQSPSSGAWVFPSQPMKENVQK